MRFVLVFPDPDTLKFVHCIGPSERHQMVAVAGIPPSSLPEADGAWRTVSLENVLTLGDIDAVIVGGPDADHAAADDVRFGFIRTCAQADLPLLISHPIGDLNMAYELQVAQTSSGLIIQPLLPGLWHSCWRMVQQSLDRQAESNDVAASTLEVQRQYLSHSMPRIRRDFVRDALIIRLLMGPMQRIHCFRQEHPTGETVTGVHVQMSDLAGRLVRWTASAGSRDRAELRVTGPKPVTIDFQGDPARWTWRTGADPPERPPPNEHPDAAALDFLEESIALSESAQKKHPPAWPFSSSPTELWTYACRAMELADAMERSARRGRTLELSAEEQSESSTFKSFMAAAGCLALAATTILTLFLIAVDRFQNRTGLWAVTGQWPWLILLLVLVVFLALQIFRIFIPENQQ